MQARAFALAYVGVHMPAHSNDHKKTGKWNSNAYMSCLPMVSPRDSEGLSPSPKINTFC